MDNNELDRILKEKLNGTIKPSKEFEEKIAQKIEEEKRKRILKQEEKRARTLQQGDEEINARLKEVQQNKEIKISEEENVQSAKFEQIQNTQKPKNYKALARILSMAAVVIVVFTLGLNLKTAPIVGDEKSANLISIKAIEPTKLESGVIANNTDFTIYVEGDNVNTESVQKSIYVEPAMDYTIEKTLNKNEYKLKFKQNIPNNTIVKLQYIKNQITENSWAYQTSNKLNVIRTYPEDNSKDVSKKSIIEVELSHANVENFDKNVTIYPNIEGSWKHGGKVWIFTPKKQLKQNQEYVVKINKGLKAGKETLDNDYTFKFLVNDDVNAVYHNGISLDDIITAKSDENVKIAYNTWYDEKIEFGNVEISRFADIDEFLEYVKNKNYEKAVKIVDYEAEDKSGYLQLKKTLQKGYYVAKVKNKKGSELFNCPVQISDISAYSMETERDVLVWVAKGNDLAQDVEVEYEGKNLKTDSQGIAKFENVTDGTEKIKYMKVGNELVVGIYNYDQANYPSAYIYTDRPLYKNTDTINIWGFVPKKLFFGNAEDEFYVELNTEGKQKVMLAEDGNFTYKIDLKNHLDSKNDTVVTLYYKDTAIASRYISIENYELQNYTYEVIANKNYGFSGENLKFDVKVKHITGLMVPNKKVVATYHEERIAQTTGEDGIAHFSIKLDEGEKDNTDPSIQSMNIYNGDDIEYTNAENYINVAILDKNVRMEEVSNTAKGEYKAKLYKLDTNRNAKVDYELKELYNGDYETNVEVNLIETEQTRHLEGYEYDPYTKQNEPHYSYTEKQSKTKIKTVTSKNGEVQVNKNEFKRKEDTEDKNYSYQIELVFKDLAGRKVVEKMYVYDDYYGLNEQGYYYSDNRRSSDRVYDTNVDISRYYMYRYLLKHNEYECKPGTPVNFKLSEVVEKATRDIANSGKVLTVAFKEQISDTNVVSDNNISYTFKDKDFPGCKITSAYFVNGKFYRMPIEYFDFDENNKKAEVQITSDKEEYKPGEEVKLKVKTLKDGKAIKSFVNISVVNEAVFEIEDDITNILEAIYEDKDYPSYTFSSYSDYMKESGEGGEGGGDGTLRARFADTAHFETVYTDKNGEATVTFKLPENVTTYRITAQSANEDLEIGVNTKKITSKLDFFVQSVEPRSIKQTDDVVLNATSIAETKYDVNYEFTIKEIEKTLTAKSKTNTISTVNFGKLPIGTYHAIIKGTHEKQSDSIEYEFKVIGSAQEVSNKTEVSINSNTKIKPTKNPIVLEIYNKDMSRYVKYMDFIESTVTERLDTQIAYNKIQEVKEKYYGEDTRNSIKHIEMYMYGGDNSGETRYLKNLRNGKEDIVLSALVRYYAKDYYKKTFEEKLSEKDNVFEYYLYKAAMGEPVLQDLLYLKDAQNIKNYNKLLVTLSLEFVGDFQNAKELYSSITLSEQEAKQYKALVAIIETFINKKQAVAKIDEMIKTAPSDEYLRFAILSYFQNSSKTIGKEETVKIKTTSSEQTVKINGMQIETLTLNNEDLSDISFETESQDIMVSYYYQTMLEDIKDKNISKDINISLDSNLKRGETTHLTIDFKNKYEGEVRIALPNSLRLAQNYREFDIDAKYYIQSNNIDYITIYKLKDCKQIKIPLLVTNSGSYKFENIVCNVNGVYHISNSLDLKF